MKNDKPLLTRISDWLQSLIPENVPQQTDEQIEADKDGFFVHVACNNCHDHLRLRIARSYDLERQDEGGFIWRKTIMDGRCFRKMQAIIIFDSRYNITSKELEGGRFVTRSAWDLTRSTPKQPPQD